MEAKPFKICFTITIIFICLLGQVCSMPSSSLCNSSEGGCSHVVEIEGMKVIMESLSSQRLTEEQMHKLSYGALRRNQPACNSGRRGESYSTQCLPPPSNTYSRGCSKIYRCRGDS